MKKYSFFFWLCTILVTLTTTPYPEQQSTFSKNISYYINYMKQLFSPFTGKSEKLIPPQPKKIPFLSSKKFMEIAERAPIAFYNPEGKILTFKKDISDITASKAEYSPILKSFTEIKNYTFSPSKRYAILNRETKYTTFNRTLARDMALFQNTAKINLLINTQSLETIASFDGILVTQQFSPSEKTLLLAGTSLGGTTGYIKEFLGIDKPSTKGSTITRENLPLREQKQTGEILKYYLFDVASGQAITTFQNVQAILFTQENEIETELYVTYDDNTTEKISIIRPIKSSLDNPFAKIITRAEKITYQAPFKTMYDHATNKLKLTIADKEIKPFDDTVSYYTSPNNKFLLINTIEKSLTQEYISSWIGSSFIKTTLLNTESGDILQQFINTITFEFNADVTRLLRSKFQEKTKTNSEKQFYQLINLLSGEIITTLPENTKSAFFDSSDILVAIDSDDKKVSYNPITGISLEKEKEKQKKLELKKQQEALKQAEDREEETIRQEREWQEAYQQPEQEQESFLGWLKSWIPGAKSTDAKKQQEQAPKTEKQQKEEKISPITAQKKHEIKEQQQQEIDYYKQQQATKADEEKAYFDLPEKEGDEEYFHPSPEAQAGDAKRATEGMQQQQKQKQQ